MSNCPDNREVSTSEHVVAEFNCWRQKAINQAIGAGIARAEVDWLLREVTEWTALDRLMHRPPPRPCNLNWLDSIWQQRIQHRIPLQQLLQTVNWRRLQLTVTDAVLIPRPETEVLVDLALGFLSEFSEPGVWADMGTGSGAIAIGMANDVPDLSVIAVDASSAALEVTTRNVKRYGLDGQISLVQGNWFKALQTSSLNGQLLQGMVSNPPYIPSQVVDRLTPEVRDREPRLALDGGADGLAAVRQLIQAAPEYVQSGGCWLVEIMFDQAREVARLLTEDGRYRQIDIHKDLDRNERFVSAKRL